MKNLVTLQDMPVTTLNALFDMYRQHGINVRLTLWKLGTPDEITEITVYDGDRMLKGYIPIDQPVDVGEHILQLLDVDLTAKEVAVELSQKFMITTERKLREWREGRKP